MSARKIWANVGVADLKRTTAFYTALGFTPNGSSAALTSFKFGEHEFIIHFFQREVLQSNVKTTLVDASLANEVVFSISAESEAEVHEWVDKVQRAGGTVHTAFERFEKGCFCLFADPDGHKFNALYWPG